MSRQSTSPNLSEGYPVTNLTLVVLLLIPAVVLLLLLNCVFLGYKLFLLSKRGRETTEDFPLKRASRSSSPDVLVFPTRMAYMSLSEPALPHPVTSSRASSRVGGEHRIRLLMPDGATGSGSWRAPSSIRTSGAGRPDLASGSRTRCIDTAGWRHSAPVLPTQSSDSEAGVRLHLVPPNSPTEIGHVVQVHHSSSAYELLNEWSPGDVNFDKVDMECEYNNPSSEESCVNTSAVQGSGLDSDFGASAGVSLRILSADSDGLSNGAVSALEWDYYDPCYVRQNNVSKHKHHRPAMHTKQYWV
ncbi:protein huluwa isoform X1 [Entelurus aequoreus]|uniref:protein huluwa isoform X1 n=1 Tax=Entelurus aequoreus TaxID=161455 RepID=UPI002B1CEF99|nr:protein huluwa isoform X1 [Entelurus aequoreus]